MTKAGKCVLEQHEPTLNEQMFKDIIIECINSGQRVYLLLLKGNNRNRKGVPISLYGDKISLLTEHLNVRYFRLKDIKELKVLSSKAAPLFLA